MIPEPREWRLGSSLLRFEPPDVFWMMLHGIHTVEDVRGALSVYRDMSHARPFIFVGELSDGFRFEPESARYLSENLPPEWVRCSIYVGGRLLHRAWAKGLALASSASTPPDAHALEAIHYVDTADEARALIVQVRAGYAGASRT